MRMALGAKQRNIFSLVIGQGIALAAAGIVLGSLGAFISDRIIRGLLFGVSPGDPITFTAVPVLLAAVTLLACYVPARRASRIDPMSALKLQ